MKIEIHDHYLEGNAPENFNHSAWLEALETEWRETVKNYYPLSEVEIHIDRQSVSGCARELQVYSDDDEEALYELENALIYDKSVLWDRHGADSKFYHEEEEAENEI